MDYKFKKLLFKRIILIVVLFIAVFLRMYVAKNFRIGSRDISLYYQVLPNSDELIKENPEHFDSMRLHLPVRHIYFHIVNFFIKICPNYNISLRITSFLFSLVFMCILFLFINKNFDYITAICALFLFGISFWSIMYSICPYSMIFLVCFTFFSSILFIKLIQGNSKVLLLYMLTTIIALNIHFIAVFVVLTHILFYLIAVAFKKTEFNFKILLIHFIMFAVSIPFYAMVLINLPEWYADDYHFNLYSGNFLLNFIIQIVDIKTKFSLYIVASVFFYLFYWSIKYSCDKVLNFFIFQALSIFILLNIVGFAADFLKLQYFYIMAPSILIILAVFSRRLMMLNYFSKISLLLLYIFLIVVASITYFNMGCHNFIRTAEYLNMNSNQEDLVAYTYDKEYLRYELLYYCRDLKIHSYKFIVENNIQKDHDCIWYVRYSKKDYKDVNFKQHCLYSRVEILPYVVDKYKRKQDIE